MSTRTIQVDYLARVEGEGSLYLKVRDNQVEEARLGIFEPPRFFEAFLRGRSFKEVADITARICGICPIAYQMSAVHAMEDAAGVTVDGPLRELRRLLYCGEWIASHALHIYMLHAPDFLGYEDAVQMAQDHGDVVNRGLKLKNAGNQIVEILGGREIHPINIRVGGFYKIPSRKEFQTMVEPLKWAREAALETVRWTAALPCPEYEHDYEFVSLRHEDEYPYNEGRIVSSKGLDIELDAYGSHFKEVHKPYSTALHSIIRDRGAYFTGPLARFNNNRDRLSPLAAEVTREIGMQHGSRNPFKSIVARSIETLFACEEALRIIENYQAPDAPYVEVEPRNGEGHGCTEAPRGILYHRYRVDHEGNIVEAQIVPPTSQNQTMMEEDLRRVAEQSLDLNDDDLQWRCEQTIRNYDPCISCSTHFLKLEIDRQ